MRTNNKKEYYVGQTDFLSNVDDIALLIKELALECTDISRIMIDLDQNQIIIEDYKDG